MHQKWLMIFLFALGFAVMAAEAGKPASFFNFLKII